MTTLLFEDDNTFICRWPHFKSGTPPSGGQGGVCRSQESGVQECARLVLCFGWLGGVLWRMLCCCVVCCGVCCVVVWCGVVCVGVTPVFQWRSAIPTHSRSAARCTRSTVRRWFTLTYILLPNLLKQLLNSHILKKKSFFWLILKLFDVLRH